MDVPAYVLIISLVFALISVIAVRFFGVKGVHVFGASLLVFFIVLFWSFSALFSDDEVIRINKTVNGHYF